MPNTRVEAGAPSHVAASATSALCAMRQATPDAPAATSDTARLEWAIASAKSWRIRAVNRDRGRISEVVSLNDVRGHDGRGQIRRRLRHHSATCW
jgi:hypothetical protein